MRDDAPTVQALRVTIAPSEVAAYRAWRRAADLDYLRVQLERRGYAMVVRLGDAHGMQRITALPGPGEAEPRYGTFGGGFFFHVRPFRGGCRLTVEAPELPLLGLPAVTEPLELTIEPLALLAEPLETPDGGGVLEERPDGPSLPWRFGLTGLMVERLVAWGWDAAVPAAYTYIFVPTNVGCIARVRDERSGTMIDLTRDTAW